MPTIGIKVDEETKKKWDILNKHPDKVGSKALRKALEKIFEEYAWWFEEYERIRERSTLTDDLDFESVVADISERDILRGLYESRKLREKDEEETDEEDEEIDMYRQFPKPEYIKKIHMYFENKE